jgi:Kef-type K+ transport system membrane component KefB
LLYPTVREAGLSTDFGVATAVGATVLTDTAALVVLAAVSGSQLAGGSAASIAIQIVVGLTVLVAFSLGLLPRLARLAFRYLGTDRVVRYLLAITSFLAAGTLAASFGIEPIVGAFSQALR